MAEVRTARDVPVGALLDLWSAVVAAVVAWPLLFGRGYLFARDAVFTPALPLRPETIGVGTGTPRAVPLDALVALASTALDGSLLGPILVFAALLLAGSAAHRLVADLSPWARVGVTAFAIWNPYVLERLGLGQWALLVGYAAVLHVVRVVKVDPSARRLAPWLALGAITPSGAVLVAGSAVVLTLGRRGWPRIAVLAVLVQLPWVLPAVVGGGALLSDPAGISAFAARAERPGGTLWTLVGLGGIWDALSVPGSRAGVLGHVTSAFTVGCLTFTFLRHRRRPGRRLWVLGLGSLVAAALTSWGIGEEVVVHLTTWLPGMGLYRDAHKWLPPFAALVLISIGVTLDDVLGLIRARAAVLAPAAAVSVAVLPFVLFPDGVVVVHKVLQPVSYPDDFSDVREIVDGQRGVLVSTPWQLYRQYPWATSYATYDPASRWFDIQVATSDDLVLGDRVIRGEDAYAKAVGEALAEADPQAALDRLRAIGVRYVLVARSEERPRWADSGASLVYAGEALQLYEVDRFAPDAAPAVAPALVYVIAGVNMGVVALLLVVSLPRRALASRVLLPFGSSHERQP